MENTADFTRIYENAYLLVPILDDDENTEERIDESIQLIKTAGAEFVGYTAQKIRQINPATFMGEGKLAEIKDELVELNVNIVIFDGQLSPAQAQNISAIYGGIKVIDRTALILDIFALHAMTKEGKLQVELAQLEYIYPRLKGMGTSLSRLGGGIGTRGPGETQLETDRRHIRNRINHIKCELEEISKRRKVQSDNRIKNKAFTVAITGYTNAGKSTLLNTLSGDNVLAEDKLFATLDPTARKVVIGDFSVIFIDTVGFIKNIPTSLISAFKSTLDSAVNADVILNVADITKDYKEQFDTTLSTLRQLNCVSPIIKVLNKCDKISNFEDYPKDVCYISAKQNLGIDKLKMKIAEILKGEFFDLELKLPYDKINEFYAVKDFTENYTVNYTDEFVQINLTAKNIYKSKFVKLSNLPQRP